MTVHQVRCVHSLKGVEGVNLYECYSGQINVPGPRVAVVGLMHGNEPVGGAVIERLEGILEQRLVSGSVLTVRANLRAAALNVRHLDDGVDMNRQWDSDNLARMKDIPDSELCYEQRRARELAPLLMQCDVVLDLHSTSRPSPACLLFRDDQRHAAIASFLNVRYLVTGLHESAILDGGMCSNLGLI